MLLSPLPVAQRRRLSETCPTSVWSKEMTFETEVGSETSRDDSMRLPDLSPNLSPADLVRIERQLRAQHGELLGGVRRLEAAASRVQAGRTSRHAPGRIDDEVAPQAILNGELEHTTRALARLASGTYGMCQVCGEPIARRRLSIIPAAVRCERCADSSNSTRTTN